MKFAILAVMAVFVSSVNAGGLRPSDTYTASGDISANAECGHSIDRKPDDVGYSVSARQTAERESSTAQSVSSNKSAACGPSSVGYAVSASRAATERDSFTQTHSYVNSTRAQTHPVLTAADYARYSVQDDSKVKVQIRSADEEIKDGGLGSHRVGGVGSSGKGSHYDGGTGTRAK